MNVTQINSIQSIYISEQDIFLNEDGLPCEATDPKRHRLLVRRGAQVPYEDVLAFGLHILLPDAPEADYIGALPPAPVDEDEPILIEEKGPVINAGEFKTFVEKPNKKGK